MAFREEFADVYPEADIAKVATAIEEHFNNGFICNAYFNNKIIGSIGAMPSEWWFSNEKFLAETWFYVLPKHRNFKTARGLLKKMKASSLDLHQLLFSKVNSSQKE